MITEKSAANAINAAEASRAIITLSTTAGQSSVSDTSTALREHHECHHDEAQLPGQRREFVEDQQRRAQRAEPCARHQHHVVA
jgi:hypothetical protein